LPCLAETREFGFQHQVSATPVPKMWKRLSVTGWSYCYCPACPVFKEMGQITPKDATPHRTIVFSECKSFWWISRVFSVAQ
jgi:hypothetical protein